MKKLIALLVLGLVATAPAFAQKYASVNAKRANIRTCAGTNCKLKFYMWRYTPVIMVKTNEDKTWVQVKDFEGYTGWISADLLSAAGGMSAKVDVNVRKEPSANADIVCTVAKGYPFKYLAKKGSWIKVVDEPLEAKDGKCTGWIYATNLWGFFKQ